jgi:hypothetical protein
VEHGLDVVAVGVENEGAVVARVVVPLARRPIVLASGRQRRGVGAVDGLPKLRLQL